VTRGVGQGWITWWMLHWLFSSTKNKKWYLTQSQSHRLVSLDFLWAVQTTYTLENQMKYFFLFLFLFDPLPVERLISSSWWLIIHEREGPRLGLEGEVDNLLSSLYTHTHIYRPMASTLVHWISNELKVALPPLALTCLSMAARLSFFLLFVLLSILV
jgi:hypothetical protein